MTVGGVLEAISRVHTSERIIMAYASAASTSWWMSSFEFWGTKCSIDHKVVTALAFVVRLKAAAHGSYVLS